MERINVTRSSMPSLEEYMEEIRALWDSRWLTNDGVKHQQLAQSLAQRFGVREVSLFSNGHQALEAAFSLFPAGAEIITTPFTFASTTLAIVRSGLIPVFCDIEPEFYTIDVSRIEALITEKTVAIAPVHVYGNLCDWRAIRKLADKHGLKVIYDAAHAFGVRDGGRDAGSLGDLSMFSFHATKVFHTIEGGCLAYDDASPAAELTAWRKFGMYDGESSEILGTNAKMTEFAAAMGLCNLRHLEDEIALRKEAVLRYRQRLSGHEGLVLCGEQQGVTSNYAYMPLRIRPETFGKDRDAVLARLQAENIFARKYFYPLTSEHPICAAFPDAETPVARQVSREILCLPLFAGLTVQEVDRICDCILA